MNVTLTKKFIMSFTNKVYKFYLKIYALKIFKIILFFIKKINMNFLKVSKTVYTSRINITKFGKN